MNVVDSSGWLSYFASDKNSRSFAEPIKSLGELLVPTITLTEVFRIILRQRGEAAALRAIAHMEQGEVVPLNEELAVDAAYFGVEYKLPLADSIIYATAHRYEALVWTQDADFKGLNNIRYYPK
ncbi:MAG: type II toxin-antitoxin system VapC family toxin [Gammaproteobacteria bacterium]|nr:type II toxin-antitoxin system VapC family toxin [Gammaproteobacteria bacterium]